MVLATQNKDKIKEIKRILGERFVVVKLKEFPEIIENGRTLEENAVKKAKAIFEITKNVESEHTCSQQNIILADDSGLEVDALGGRPGVRSARFAGENCSYSDNNKKLLKLLKNVPYGKRKAKFRTIVAIIFPDGKIRITEGAVAGYIAMELKGENGFGYDPLFYYPKLKKTYAQLTITQKNEISHRAIAFKKASRAIEGLIGK